MVRRAARTDDNQAEVVEALRKVGAFVQSLAMVGAGCPDLLVTFRRQAYLLEVKDGRKPPSARALTPLESKWHNACGLEVAVVLTPQDALRAIGAMR